MRLLRNRVCATSLLDLPSMTRLRTSTSRSVRIPLFLSEQMLDNDVAIAKYSFPRSLFQHSMNRLIGALCCTLLIPEWQSALLPGVPSPYLITLLVYPQWVYHASRRWNTARLHGAEATAWSVCVKRTPLLLVIIPVNVLYVKTFSVLVMRSLLCETVRETPCFQGLSFLVGMA